MRSNAQVTTENQLKYLTRVRRRAEGEGGAGHGELHHQTHPLAALVEGSTLREALTHQEDHFQGCERGEARGGGTVPRQPPLPSSPIALVCSAGPLSNIGSFLIRQVAQRGIQELAKVTQEEGGC